jgi:hypothetical protein
VKKTFDPPEGDQQALVGVNCVPRESWQLLVQQQANGTWRCVDEYSRLIAGDDIPKVSFLFLAQYIKEPFPC